jgi:hypothetical protein
MMYPQPTPVPDIKSGIFVALPKNVSYPARFFAELRNPVRSGDPLRL